MCVCVVLCVVLRVDLCVDLRVDLCVVLRAFVFQEHHLQRAISAQQVFREKKENMVIPVPEAESNTTYYDRLYKGEVKVPKQLIHIQRESSFIPIYTCNTSAEGTEVQSGSVLLCLTMLYNMCSVCGHTALGLDLEQPDYDMDSEDETLLNRLNRKMEIKPLQFETMVDRLEKASTHQVSMNPPHTHTPGDSSDIANVTVWSGLV